MPRGTSVQPSQHATKLQVRDRIDHAEELLASGISPSRAERALADKYSVSIGSARKYLGKVRERWTQQADEEAPARREKVYRMTERFYARALGAKEYSAAAQALGLLAKMSGASNMSDAKRTDILAQLGPVPSDPTEGLIYAQKVMLHALNEIVANPAIEPERRLRLISDIGGKIGMTHAKALVQHRLAEVARQVLPAEVIENDEGVAVDPREWDRFRPARASDEGAEPLLGPGSDPPTPENGGVAT